MELNKYQIAINEHFANYAGNSAVISVAGSGKTTSALNAIAKLPVGTSTLLGAFNTSIRDEFKAKGLKAGLRGVTYANFNGFGWGICSRNLKSLPELDKEKTEKVLEFIVYKPNLEDEADVKRFNTWKGPIKRLVSLFKNLNIHSPEEASARLSDIINYYNLETPLEEAFTQCALDTFKATIEHQAHYDFDDQKYMPIHFGWPIPVFDQVVLDEFQDTCPIEYELMKAAAVGGQFCAIGDPDQTIYGFKGAAPGIFKDFLQETNAKELPLSICYRCPKAVVREAKKIVPRIEWAPTAAEGVVDEFNKNNFMKRVKPKDFAICRTTDELISTQIALTEMGIPSKVRGREFGTLLEIVINFVSEYKKGMPIDEFTTRLIDYQMKRSAQLAKLRRDSEIVNLEDRCRSIRALSNNAPDVGTVLKNMKNIFSDTPHDGVDLMTIHKSKGLQATNVWILRPDLLPHPRSSERQWMLEEENRLKYVAVTRSMEFLGWVK